MKILLEQDSVLEIARSGCVVRPGDEVLSWIVARDSYSWGLDYSKFSFFVSPTFLDMCLFLFCIIGSVWCRSA